MAIGHPKYRYPGGKWGGRWGWAAALALGLILLPALPSSGTEVLATGPKRVVSMNLCADQLVVALADRAQILSVSHIATSAAISAVADKAVGLPVNYGKAEEILPLRPDLVVGRSGWSEVTLALLEQMGVPLLQLPAHAESWDQIHNLIDTVATALGQKERGKRLLEALEARLAALPPPPAAAGSARAPLAIVYQASGFTTGPSTLPHLALTMAGFQTLAQGPGGMPAYGYLSLEGLIAARPALVVIDSYRPNVPSGAQARFNHPALTGLGQRRLDMPAALWTCPAPTFVTAVETLAAARRALDAETGEGPGTDLTTQAGAGTGAGRQP